MEEFEKILSLTVPEIKERIRELEASELERLKALEVSGKGRKGVIRSIDSKLKHLRKGLVTRYGFVPDTIFKPRDYEGLRDGKWIRFGLCGDTHLINNYHDSEAWQRYCADLVKEGIVQLFHAGDFWDGCTSSVEVYRGQRLDVPIVNFDKAMDEIAKTCPDFGLKKDFILGNHDAKVYEMEGVDAGKIMVMKREQHGHDDFRYLQPYYARIELSSNPLVYLDLVHLRRYPSYSLGYAMQVYLREVPPRMRAHVYGFGHTHKKAWAAVEDEAECFLVGCFQKPNSYSIRQRKGTAIGGWLVELKLATNSPNPIDRLRAEFLRYD